MMNFKTIVILAVLLGLSAIVINGVAYGQSTTIGQSDQGGTFMSNIPNYQQYASDGMHATNPAPADEAASSQSIIFENGKPTTLIGADGVTTSYDPAMWDFIGEYPPGGPYGVCTSSNPDVPTTGTWTSTMVVESGTLGTQEPNMNLS